MPGQERKPSDCNTAVSQFQNQLILLRSEEWIPALRLISEGAQKASFGTKKTLSSALAEEIIAAANHDVKGYAMGKKDNIERVAKSSTVNRITTVV